MGSGPVITSAKTRRCEYSHTDADDQVDNAPSCKHMCCREGVDKAPKAPKSSSVSAVKLTDSSHLSGRISKNGRAATAKKSADISIPRNEQEADIEKVDLASGQTLERYPKMPAIALRSLDRLHDNVTKERTAPVAIKKQPSFGYMNGRQPQISFLNENAGAEISNDKQSTDYDTDWMGDLPSPSALLGKPPKKDSPLPEHTSTYNGSNRSDGHLFPSALIRQNDAATGNYPDKNSLEGLDLSQFNDDESEIEAAMVGLSDSVTMQGDSQVQAAIGQTSSQANAYPHWSPPADKSTPKLHHSSTVKGESSGTSRLFFSTDSPEKEAELLQKRKAGVGDQVEDLSQSAPLSKRPRVSDEHDQPRRSLSSAEKQTLLATPIVRPGQPAWVYEFDAAFIAEWQDIVDFV